MNPAAKKLLSLFASILIAVPLYILLHEGGHGLVEVLCGARITDFSILGAYMRYEGGVFSPLALSLFHAAGMLLPVLLSVVYMLAYRTERTGVFYRIFSFVSLLIPVGSLLAWVIVPVLYMAGQVPPDDDVTKLISSSGLSPWIVLLGAIALFAVCLSIAWRKKILQNYWTAVKSDC